MTSFPSLCFQFSHLFNRDQDDTFAGGRCPKGCYPECTYQHSRGLHPHHDTSFSPSLGISKALPCITFLALWAVKDQHPTTIVHPFLGWSRTHPSPESPPGCPHLAPSNFHKILFLLLWRQDMTDIVILEEEAEKMNSGPQCPGFKSQLRQLPSQAWWLSLKSYSHTCWPPREGQPDLPSHTVCPGPPFAPARTLGCREVLRTLTHGPCTKSPDPGACGGRRGNRSCQ